MLRIRPGSSEPVAGPAPSAGGTFHSAGASGSVADAPKWATIGPATRYDSTAPAIIMEAIRGPIR